MMNYFSTRRSWATAAMILLSASFRPAIAQNNDQGPAPAATGPDTTTQVIENPPLSGLDAPSFEPGFGARSYLQPRVELTDAVDTNTSGTLTSNPAINNVIRGLGSLMLQKLWKIHPLDLDYVGGVAHYYGAGLKTTYQVHSLVATQRFLWRTGQFAIRDGFSYLPEGTFGFSSFGGAGGFGGGGGLGGLGGGIASGGGIVNGGGSGVFTSGQFGSLNNEPRITNLSIADLTQALSPRSALVLSGGWGLTDFINAPKGYINSQQVIGQAGYSYQLSRRDQIALLYAFEEFHFPSSSSGSFSANVWQLIYGHRITGKLDFRVGGGPQWIHAYGYTQLLPGVRIQNNFSSLSAAGTASFVYHKSSRTDLTLSYSRYVNPGSGFFAGSDTNAARVAFSHALTRRWNMMMDGGYSRNSRILNGPTVIVNHAKTYEYWYAGAALRRQLGRHFGAFASYQYNALNFESGFCAAGQSSCAHQNGRNIGAVGVDWTPHPIRLD